MWTGKRNGNFLISLVFILVSFNLVIAWLISLPSSSLLGRRVTCWKANAAKDFIKSFDEAVIYVRGGSGGPGSSAVKFAKARQHAAPYGGSGGNGGSVYLKIDFSLNTLRKFQKQKSFHAENGSPGDKEYRNGQYGKDLYIPIPVGTTVYDNTTQEKLAELTLDNPLVLIAKGGQGGYGNASGMKRSDGKPGCIPPESGEKKWLKLELQLLANIGLIGFPNAGKSTLLKALTNANPKIADYAFTTLIPNLGVSFLDEEKDPSMSMIIADIPGLIEGAHQGIGLGKDFLKHVEKCEILIHVINGNSSTPIEDYLTVNRELIFYSKILVNKPQIVVVNKIDLPHVKAKQEEILQEFRRILPHSRLLAISAKESLEIVDLKWKTWNFLMKVKAPVS